MPNQKKPATHEVLASEFFDNAAATFARADESGEAVHVKDDDGSTRLIINPRTAPKSTLDD